MTPDPAQSLANLRLERDAILLYDALGAIGKDENRAAAFHRIASNERRHAEVWATKLREAGVDVPEPPARPRARVSAIILLARLFGTRAVSDLVTALEGDEEQIYGEQSSPEVEAIAADEMEAMPEEEEAEMAALYRAKGFRDDEAKAIAHRLFEDPERALDQLIREELGLDPDELGSPFGAAGGSFVAFAIGAFIPVAPYIVTFGAGAFAASILLSVVALFGVGVGVSLLTGRSALFSGARQVGIGAAAAIVTYAVGSLIGVSVAS